MKIVKANQAGLAAAVQAIKRNRPVVFPTDTAYALGGIFDSSVVQRQIAAIKKRGDSKFTLVAASTSQVEKNFGLNDRQKKLAKKFWPGPLTLVLKMKNGVRLHGVKQCTAAIRISSHPVARALSHALGKPLIATSANKSGFSVCYGVFCIKKSLQRAFFKVDLVLDAGKLPKQSPSTIVDAQSEKIEILRQGAVDPRSVKLSEKLRPQLF